MCIRDSPCTEWSAYLVEWGAAEWEVLVIVGLLNGDDILDSSNETIAVKHEDNIKVISVADITITRMPEKVFFYLCK